MDDRTKKILMAAGAGIVLAYFFSRPAAAAETGEDKKPGGDGGLRNLTDGGGGTGGGGTVDRFPKSTLYGDANVEAYQRRIAQIASSVRDYLVNFPGAFEATGLLIPGIDGDWGDGTQRASDAFIKLLYRATNVINADPKATAAYRKRDGAFRFIQELVRDLQGAGGADVVLPQIAFFGTPEKIEAALVKGAGSFGTRSVSKSDHWAFGAAGGELSAKGVPKGPYPYS